MGLCSIIIADESAVCKVMLRIVPNSIGRGERERGSGGGGGGG